VPRGRFPLDVSLFYGTLEQFFMWINHDDFVKNPTSVLLCILRHCGVPVSTPHSSGFARLEFEAFYFVVRFPTFSGSSTMRSNFF